MKNTTKVTTKIWSNPAKIACGWAFFIFAYSICLSHASAATPVYYIDFNNGNDQNAGTSQQTAWKTIPGTENSTNASYLNSCWGNPCVISGNSPVVPGTTFKLRPGTTYNTTSSGSIAIYGGDLYPQHTAANNPIIFEPDPTWASSSGPVVFDGSGLSTTNLEAFIVIKQVDGVEFNGLSGDGATFGGITIQNSPLTGMEYKTYSFLTPDINPVVQYVYFFNNGTADLTGLAGGDVHALYYKNTSGGSVSYCAFNGNNEYINGFATGDSLMGAVNLTVSNSSSYNNKGDLEADSGGRAFFGLNSQITFNNDTAFNNFKGWDVGEYHGNGATLFYKIINSKSYGNDYGMNLNGAGEESGNEGAPGPANFYVINNLIYNNNQTGSNIYAGPWNAYVVNNVYANNGMGIYTFTVSGVTTAPVVGTIYTTGSGGTLITYTIVSSSISGGSGTVQAIASSYPALGGGILTKTSGTGDNSIAYSANINNGGANIYTAPDIEDSSSINLYLYNNIFYKPAGVKNNANFNENRISTAPGNTGSSSISVTYAGTAATSSGTTLTDTTQSFASVVAGQYLTVTSGTGVAPGKYLINPTITIGSNVGTGYQVGDILNIIQSGASDGAVEVTAVSSGGQISVISPYYFGSGYTTANGLTTTGGSGNGKATVNFTAASTGTTLNVTPSLGSGSGISYYIGTNFSLYSDYNSWVQNSTEPFVQWSYFGGSYDTHFNYGSNGPGYASGNWHSNIDQFGNATGHQNSDAHSKGTGAGDPTLPLFTNATTDDFTLTAHYSGTNLSTKPWYIPEMGLDRNGNTRTSWDMGAYEFGSAASTLLGDVNGDGAVNIADAEMTAQAAMGLVALNTAQQKLAEVSSTSETKPSIYDAFLIAEYVAGLISKFPVQG